MFSQKDYEAFKKDLEPIITSSKVLNLTRENIIQNKYFVQRGIWPGTEKNIFAYDMQIVKSHEKNLLELAKRLPLFKKASHGNAGILVSFDLLTDIHQNPVSKSELIEQINLANHYMNLLSATGIAELKRSKVDTSSPTVLMVLNEKYRDFFEQDGQESADN